MSESEKIMREVRRSLTFTNKRPIEWIVGYGVFDDLISGCYFGDSESFTFEGVPLKRSDSFKENVICVVTENLGVVA